MCQVFRLVVADVSTFCRTPGTPGVEASAVATTSAPDSISAMAAATVAQPAADDPQAPLQQQPRKRKAVHEHPKPLTAKPQPATAVQLYCAPWSLIITLVTATIRCSVKGFQRSLLRMQT
jgi:hypothetical protein